MKITNPNNKTKSIQSKSLADVIDGATEVAEQFGYSPRADDMPDQELDEVIVTAPKQDFLTKYKFYIIGAILLLVILLKKK